MARTPVGAISQCTARGPSWIELAALLAMASCGLPIAVVDITEAAKTDPDAGQDSDLAPGSLPARDAGSEAAFDDASDTWHAPSCDASQCASDPAESAADGGGQQVDSIDDCSVCLQLEGFPIGSDCTSACRLIGYQDGECAYPGSEDPGYCCHCLGPGPSDDPPPDDPPPPAALFQYRGVAFSRPYYDYAPSVMRDGDGRFRMWWCGMDPARVPEIIDVIYYAESWDGVGWTAPQKVIASAGPPHQGLWACDPSVVKASNGYYYMFFTSEQASCMCNNQVFLAWSGDGINWSHVNEQRAVVPLVAPDGSYGIGQSSVIFKDGQFVHLYTDTSSGGHNIFAAASGNGGTVFTPLNGGRPVVEHMTAFDLKYIASRDLYLAVAEGPWTQWKLVLLVLDTGFRELARYEVAAEVLPNPCNHNPALLGDAAGNLVESEIVPVYFGAGTMGTDGCHSGHASWDIHVLDANLRAILDTL